MLVAVVDIGTNSTRLLVADVVPGAGPQPARVRELERVSTVTRLGQGVDRSGRLSEAAVERVFATLEDYTRRMDAAGVATRVGVLTSAVRDAANGAQFAAGVRERFGIDARTIDGEEEARLSFRGATSERDLATLTAPLLVIDIGGGSTELIVGDAAGVAFHVSTQAGVVRQTERHLDGDPPAPARLQELAAEVRGILAAAVPDEVRRAPRAGIAVAGTATSLAAIDLALEPYDPERVHGRVLALGRVEELLARLAALPLDQRRGVAGLHRDRASTIVAGAVILVEVMRAFDLDAVEVSEQDLLRGVVLEGAALDRPLPPT